jgi:large subunit ribosomal protein L4
MFDAPHFSAAGAKHKTAFALPADLFDGTVNEAVLHQAVTSYLGNQRQGTAKTKRRQEVSGGNQKPWKQKGTGRARQGTTRAPHFRGGGVVFGPIPRSYRIELPRKVRQLARRSALNARAREGMLHVVDPIVMEAPKSRVLIDLLAKLGLTGVRTLVLTDGAKSVVHLSGRNVPGITVLPFADATAYEILHAHALVIEASALADSTKETG